MTPEIPVAKLSGSIPKDAYVLLIGAMKCGTTSLFHYLKEHPQICPSVAKEPEYFSSGPQDKKIVDVDFYEDLWAFDPEKHKYALEGSTGYTKFPLKQGVPERIYQAGIQPKFIYVVRNPFDRIESHFNHLLKKGQENRRLNDDIFVSFSNYYQQLKQYTEKFPKESILVLNYELLDKNPVECLQAIYKFLELPNHYIPAEFHRRNIMRQIGIGEKIFNSLIVKRVFKKKRIHIIRFMDRFFPPPSRPKLTAAERQIIYKELYNDMQKLQTEFGVDVKRWGF